MSLISGQYLVEVITHRGQAIVSAILSWCHMTSPDLSELNIVQYIIPPHVRNSPQQLASVFIHKHATTKISPSSRHHAGRLPGPSAEWQARWCRGRCRALPREQLARLYHPWNWRLPPCFKRWRQQHKSRELSRLQMMIPNLETSTFHPVKMYYTHSCALKLVWSELGVKKVAWDVKVCKNIIKVVLKGFLFWSAHMEIMTTSKLEAWPNGRYFADRMLEFGFKFHKIFITRVPLTMSQQRYM